MSQWSFTARLRTRKNLARFLTVRLAYQTMSQYLIQEYSLRKTCTQTLKYPPDIKIKLLSSLRRNSHRLGFLVDIYNQHYFSVEPVRVHCTIVWLCLINWYLSLISVSCLFACSQKTRVCICGIDKWTFLCLLSSCVLCLLMFYVPFIYIKLNFGLKSCQFEVSYVRDIHRIQDTVCFIISFLRNLHVVYNASLVIIKQHKTELHFTTSNRQHYNTLHVKIAPIRAWSFL